MDAVNASLIDDNLTLLEPGPASFMVVDPPPGGEAEPILGLSQDLDLLNEGVDPPQSDSIFPIAHGQLDLKPEQYSSLIDLTADTMLKEGFEPKVMDSLGWAGEVAKENRPQSVRLDEGECGVCQAGFASSEAKKTHLLASHPCVRVFPCGLCQEPLFSSAHLKAHMRMHTKEKPLGQQRPQDFKCEHCAQYGLNTNEKLLSHVEQCHAFQCPSCPLHFPTAMVLTRHYRQMHFQRHKAVLKDSQVYIPATKVSIQLPGKCIFCPASEIFVTAKAFDQHVLENHPYKCPLCPKMVKHSTSIRKHFKTHHIKHRAVFCRHCVSVFTNEKDCEIHNQLCQGLDPKRLNAFKIPSLEELQRIEISTPDPDDFVAEVITEIPAVFEEGPCDGDYGDIEDMPVDEYLDPSARFEPPDAPKADDQAEANEESESQPEEEEEEEGSHPCKNCDEEFDSEPELLEHIVDNHPFTCPACHRPYKAYDSLRKHCRVMHENLYIAVCKICVLVFTDAESKQSHQRRVHKQSSAIETPKRQTNGQSRAILGRSSSTDSSEPCFTCPYCDKTYFVADSLRKHSKVVHGKVCVSCVYCGLSFTSIEERKVHLATPEHLEVARSFGAEQSIVKPPTVPLESRRAAVVKAPVHPPTPPSIPQPATLSQSPSPTKVSSPVKRPASVVRRSTNKVPQLYECFWCDKKYDLGDSLRRHAKKIHDQFVSVCKFCPISYTDVEVRDAHMLESHHYKVGGIQPPTPSVPIQTSPPPHLEIKLGPEANQCSNWNCNLTFPFRFDLEAHIKEFHPIPCPLCPDRRYRQRRTLLKHCRDVHKDLRVYFCDHCDETFCSEKQSLVHADNCKGNATLPDPIESRSTSPDFHGFDGVPTKKLKSQINATETFRTALKQIDNPLNLNWEILERVIEFQD
ncbi:hypothetical protein TCAL_06914 [Tigriopus californicus]|uniref:C2H2-type domain-containing protein n=1 Tax=Tigriopus californicus TaxID=6832 RepID=A0A553PJX1_TIGCA|nr:zinc finger protein Xfin-like [Tigriopus californicus]TRY77973.1 hypothetical protein TCAL_06914 [Tigriopus californicus]|eukprot:TCALIF_06914-PA protein Name:"Similar to ZNF425 Zinc finger protein 425 (Homo sapiens)" AED:0.05 eAED:0.05 QI:0/-1/0/1/-1/1/1/0/909